MNKVKTFIKKTLKAIQWVAVILVLLFVIIAALTQIPAIQNKIATIATSFISNETHTRVEIKNIRFSFPKSVVIEGLFLEDVQKDTLLFVGKAKINIALYALISSEIAISSFALGNANINLYNTGTDSLFNYNFLLKAFSDTTTITKINPKSESKWTFSIDKISLKKIRLRYDDEFGGMSATAVLRELELKMDKIDIVKSIYNIDELLIESLKANVQMKKPANADTKKSENILPIIMAKNIQINNSDIAYTDGINKQSVNAAINRFEIKDGLADFQKELISFDKLDLSKSKIEYNTIDTTYNNDTNIVADITTSTNNWKVTAKSIVLDDNSLAYMVNNKPEIKNTFDISNMKFSHLKLEATDLFYSLDATQISIKKFSAIDQNQFSIAKFETEFSMDQHSITMKKLKAGTTNSSIAADLNIQYSSLKSLKDSIPFIVLKLELEDVSIKTADVLYFNPQLIKQPFFRNKTNITTISGFVNGKMNNLKGENMVIKTGVGTLLKTDISIAGLPDAATAFYNFPNLKLYTTKRDIVMMAGPTIPISIELPENLTLKLAFKGTMKSFESTMGVGSSFGSANLFTTIDKNENFRSKVSMTSFELGRLLKNTTMYGPVTLIAETKGHGLDKNSITAKIDAEVSEIYLNKYTYHNLIIDGNIHGQEFEGKVNLNDENAIFSFDGLVNINPNQEHYKFQLNVQRADLQKLNFTKDDIRIGLTAAADLKGGTLNNMNGTAGISSMVVAMGEKVYTLDSVLIASINEPNKSELNISSTLVGIKYSGNISPGSLKAELSDFINNYFRSSDIINTKTQSIPSDFTFEIQLHNHPMLSQILFPQLKEFEPGIIRGNFDSEKNELKLYTTMKKIVYGTTEINDLAVIVNSDSAALNYKISVSNISNAQIKLDNFLIDGKLENNKLFANVLSIADNQNKKIVIRSQITRDKTIYRLVLDPKDFYLLNNKWDIASDNYIEFGKDGFLIHHFFMTNNESHINITSVHDKFNDDLNLAIMNFKLDDISRIIAKDTSLVKGNVDGNILLKRVNNSYGIITDAKISSLIVGDVPIGDLSVKADNPTTERFDLDVNLSGTDNNLTAKGYYIPTGGNNSISLKTDIQSLSMKTIEAFSMGQITEAAGTVTGNIFVQGASNKPKITGELVFNDAFIKPVVLNNRLELKHETIQIKADGIYFNSFTLLDADKNSAIIDGTVKMKQFKDFVFNLHVNTKDFLLFNTTLKDNKEFFGRMIVDSKIDVNGPMALPIVNAEIKMKKGSNFTFAVPEEKLSTDKGEDVVEFEDSLKLNSILIKTGGGASSKNGFTGFDLTSVIQIDKVATLRLLMDPSTTDSLVVKGEAALSLTMDRSGKMSLTGVYNLDEGSYLVSFESIIKRKFEINSGSTIIWNGDPLDAEISINATYSIRASPIDLVADQMSGLSQVDKSAYKQKFPFLILLKLRGEILHPEISFEIQLPPEDKGILGGAVNAKLNLLNDDPSALNKQVFALLVLGRFIQENPLQTDANNGASTVVRVTVGKFLSAQLNQLSSKIVPGVELNFDIQSYDDYSTGQAQGRTQVELELKKQLFNERISVQVGGNVDVEGVKAKQNSPSDITSDVTVEYKLTKDGRYRLKGFRHNQYEGAIDGLIIETGVGVSYVHDFSKWKDFFRAPKKAKVTIPEK
ncbi:translocation/assembly module TamB domain-containing protein [Candidatus Neomarinimicrobiota bacterium]